MPIAGAPVGSTRQTCCSQRSNVGGCGRADVGARTCNGWRARCRRRLADLSTTGQHKSWKKQQQLLQHGARWCGAHEATRRQTRARSRVRAGASTPRHRRAGAEARSHRANRKRWPRGCDGRRSCMQTPISRTLRQRRNFPRFRGATGAASFCLSTRERKKGRTAQGQGRDVQARRRQRIACWGTGTSGRSARSLMSPTCRQPGVHATACAQEKRPQEETHAHTHTRKNHVLHVRPNTSSPSVPY